METESESSNKTNYVLFVGASILYMIMSFVLLLGCAATFYFSWKFPSYLVDTAYYEDCQYIEQSGACNRCCREHGHSDHASGTSFNEGDKTCGCIE